jgi:hypothetical protein
MNAGDIQGLTATTSKTFCLDEANRFGDETTDALVALVTAKKDEAGVRMFASLNPGYPGR